ncbi:MAG: DNA repair protein RecO [Acidobacteriota bacterium]
MPLRRVESIVLRTYRVGEADKVVVFFTREVGKIRGIAKGARRSRSRFGGSLEMGTQVELTFFEKEGQELVRVDRCDILRSRFSRWGAPVLACSLAYYADLVDAFAPEREPNVNLYRLLKATISALASGEPELTTRYFEAWLLRLGGLYPRRETCPVCGAELIRQGARYLVEEHTLACNRCAPRGVSLSPETLGYLGRVWQESPRSLPPPGAPHVLSELAVLHQMLIGQQLERELSSYRVLGDMMRMERQE